ncbi:maltose permease [Grosmannia clavigera kw1407]|uniref:Maltose permease n=1 Tax=Grosmannia clavigera (strain kw1407 / UAMH 11150) TaxID=655863 RepID=F0XBD9_GROCL|nr:maltose permease [Grosmannia clavigera kw1407]EFX04971.1 maltose permease [Grosmannia clavigera kw1407]
MTVAKEPKDVHSAHLEHADGDVVLPDEHDEGQWHCIKNNKVCVAWLLYIIFVLCIQGFDNQAGSIVISIEQFRKDFGYYYDGNYVLPAKWQSAFSGGPVASAIVGALISAQLADRVGRRWTILATICVSFVGTGLEFASTTNALFFAGKFVNGLAVGSFNTICVSYISEISPLPIRGLFTGLSNVSLCIGPFICTGLGERYGNLSTRWAYRGIFVAQWGFGFLGLIFCPFMPESPWWLLSVGRTAAARQALSRLSVPANQLDGRLEQIRMTQLRAQEQTASASYVACFRGTNLRRTLLTICPLTVQAMGGVMFISSYQTYYFELAGNSVHRSFQLSLGSQGLSLVGSITASLLIDRIGRRTIIVYGTLAMAVLLILTGGLATATEPGTLQATVGFMMLYNAVFNFCLGSAAYTIVSEIPTFALRAKSIGISIVCQQALYTAQAFVLPYIFNPDKANLGAKTSFIYGGCCLISLVVLFFFQPETKNRTFEELDELFMNRVPARQFASYVTTVQK